MVYKVIGSEFGGFFVNKDKFNVFTYSTKWKKDFYIFSLIFLENKTTDILLYCFIEVVIF